MDGLSISEFADHVGKSHVWIIKLIKRGIIPQNEDGSIPVDSGFAEYEKYINSPGYKKMRKAQEQAAEKKSAKPKRKKVAEEKADIPQPEISLDDKAKDAVNLNTAMRKAKLAQTTFQARLRELEYKLKSGELLPKSEVAAEAQWLAEQVKTKLLAIPPRISSMCEGRIAREIEEIITDAINSALAELQKCQYTKEDVTVKK